MAMTRAQVSLHVTWASTRMRGGKLFVVCFCFPAHVKAAFSDNTSMSPFLSPIASPTRGFFVGFADEFDDEKRDIMWKILSRPPASTEDVAAVIAE